MKNIVSTVSIIMAAGITIGAIAAISAASAQIYTKGGYVETPLAVDTTRVSTADAGIVTHVTPPPATLLSPSPPQPSQPAAIALGPAPSVPSVPTVPSVPSVPTVPTPSEIAIVNTTPQTPQTAVTATHASHGNCGKNRQAIAFDNPTINFRGVSYHYSPTPPLNYAGGAAVAAIYPSINGQSEICYSGSCVNGPAGTCTAIAVTQPSGRARIYVR